MMYCCDCSMHPQCDQNDGKFNMFDFGPCVRDRLVVDMGKIMVCLCLHSSIPPATTFFAIVVGAMILVYVLAGISLLVSGVTGVVIGFCQGVVFMGNEGSAWVKIKRGESGL